jgi:hypothetical protein
MRLHQLRKRAVTLVELLIAIGLLALLMTTLFGIYRYIDSTQRKVAQEEKGNFRLLYAQHRLSEVIPQSVSKSEAKEDYYFYTQTSHHAPTSLVFTYDNGADGIPLFSGHVFGKVFLEPNGDLSLATWPIISREPNNPPMRKELLLDNVKDIRFSFYMPPRKDIKDKPQDSALEEKYNRWHSEWPVDITQEDFRDLPSMVKVIVTLKNNEEIVFAFALTNAKRHIIYHE